jgi:hypothetical protein
MAPCPAAEFPRLPASETAYRLARNRERFLVQRQRLQRGKPFNVSSEHHIVGTQGKDMPAAMRPTQDHHGSRRQGCAPGASRRIVRVSDMSSKSSSHRHTRLQRDLSAAVPHMVCTIAAGSRPPVGAPSILMRKDSAAFLVWNPPALASPVCDLPRPLANRCYCEAGECEVDWAKPCHHSQFHAALPCNSQNLPYNTQNLSLLLVLARTPSNPLKPLENLTE